MEPNKSNNLANNSAVTKCDKENCQSKYSNVQNNFTIGMTYVPWQEWQNIYEPHNALKMGTIFADLNLPFCGVRGIRR